MEKNRKLSPAHLESTYLFQNLDLGLSNRPSFDLSESYLILHLQNKIPSAQMPDVSKALLPMKIKRKFVLCANTSLK